MEDLAALRLQIEWGADEALEPEPVNRLHALSPASHPMAQGAGQIATAKAEENAARPIAGLNRESDQGRGEGAANLSAPRSTAAERAHQVAGSAPTLEALRAAIASFDGCSLRDTAGNIVFAEGDPSAGLLLIGDAPGAAEDRSGTPFAGPAGAYLDRMLASIGLQRSQLMLAALIPWRPPGDRPPNPAELAICMPFLHRQIALATPRRLVLLGPLATRSLLGQIGSRRRARGAWLEAAIPGVSGTLPTLPTFRPTDLMRNPADRRAAWADLRLLRRTLNSDDA